MIQPQFCHHLNEDGTVCGKPYTTRARKAANKIDLCENHLKQFLCKQRLYENWTREEIEALKQIYAAKRLSIQLKKELMKRHSETSIISKAKTLKIHCRLPKTKEAPLCSA